MSMNPIARIVVAALLLTGSAVPSPVPNINNTTATTPIAIVSTAETTARLTAEEAAVIALQHAGLTQEEVTGLTTRQEKEDGIVLWEVKFRSGDIRFEYEIHPETGEILDVDRERTRPRQEPQPTEPAPKPTPGPSEPQLTQPVTMLTEAQALEIALQHAGLTQDQISCLEIEKDREHGITVFEIEFRVGQMEYEFEIHAETGEILEYHKEIDD